MDLVVCEHSEGHLTEHEMPGLMAARAEFGPSQPSQGLNFSMLIETLSAVGATVRWASYSIFKTRDPAAAAIAKFGTAAVFT